MCECVKIYYPVCTRSVSRTSHEFDIKHKLGIKRANTYRKRMQSSMFPLFSGKDHQQSSHEPGNIEGTDAQQ